MNAERELPISGRTVAEKLDVIDLLNSDHSHNFAAVPVIEWHGDLLKQRAEAIERGDDSFITLDEAEYKIRYKVGS